MDETPVLSDMVASMTVATTGRRDVSLKYTGHEKACLAAKADGSKLKPYIVCRGAVCECKALQNDFKGRCIVTASANGWMNTELTLDWINKVVGPFAFCQRVLAWDTYTCHMEDTVAEDLKRKKVDVVFVLRGCTKSEKFKSAPL